MPRALLPILLLLLGSCSRREPPTPTPTTEPRIVVLSPALAAILDDIGYAEHAVGRHAYDMVLDPSLPVCGEQTGINYEALLRAEPTHVLIEWGSRELPARLTDLAARHGWTVRPFNLLTLEDIDKAAAELAALFPDAEAGDRIARFHALTAGPTPEPRWRGRVLLLSSVSPQITALGPGSAHHELLRRAGGVPAIPAGTPYMPLHTEDVLRLAPDAIVLIRLPSADGEAPPPQTPRAALGPIADLRVPAVEHLRIGLVDDPLALLPSTRLLAVADRFKALLEAWSEP